MEEDTVSVSVLDIRTQALAMAIDAKEEGEADSVTIDRASAFYDWIRQDAVIPKPAPPKGNGGGVVPFKGKKH